MNNYMVLKISAISENECFARSVVAAFCVKLNPTIDQINDIKTAVSEAVTNSIVHGYNGEGGEIEIRAEIIDKSVHIEIKDDGVGIPDIEKARQPFFTTKPGEERSGMGFTVMESFMDTLTVCSNNGKGVVVTMCKSLDVNKNNEDESIC